MPIDLIPTSGSAHGSAPLPPLPNLSSGGDQEARGNPLDSLIAGIGPVVKARDMIQEACKLVVQSGMVPGVEQSAGQVLALANSWVPMAAQQHLQPQNAGQPTPMGPVGGM